MPSVAPQTTTTTRLSLSILLPTYNEHDNLPLITYLISKELAKSSCIADYEIIVVDDNSPDGTGLVADRLSNPLYNGGLLQSGQMKVLKRAGKQGLGSAYIYGASHARFPYIVILDADLSHHPNCIIKMVETMIASQGQLDIVTGSRYIDGGGVYGWNLTRRCVSRGANFLADWLLDPKVSDLTGSFRLYKRDCFVRLIGETVTKGYTFQMEIMVRARKHNMKIAQVPITFVDRQFGESKLGGGEILGYLKGLWTLFSTV